MVIVIVIVIILFVLSIPQACLRNFEKFTKTKICPLCRQSKYQKKPITDGFEYYKEMSAIR